MIKWLTYLGTGANGTNQMLLSQYKGYINPFGETRSIEFLGDYVRGADLKYSGQGTPGGSSFTPDTQYTYLLANGNYIHFYVRHGTPSPGYGVEFDFYKASGELFNIFSYWSDAYPAHLLQHVGVGFEYDTDREVMWPIWMKTWRLQEVYDNTSIVSAVFNYSGSQETLEHDLYEYFTGSFIDDSIDALPESDTGGGRGNLDNTSDTIGLPDLPTLSATDTGFLTLYNPTLSQLKSLANYMWTDDFLTNIKKLFGDPMDVILGLSIIPVAVPDGGIQLVQVGNVQTNVSMTLAASQYVRVSCGSIDVPEYWGAYLDYSPYTKMLLFLPFLGYKELSADELIGATVGITYNVDILSGSFIAFVTVGGSVIAQYQGTCAVNIPVTSMNYSQMIASLVSGVASVGAAAATGGVSVAGAVAAGATTSVQMKPSFEHSGSATPSGGIMGNRTPYLCITRPRQCKPRNYNNYVGYPSYITRTLNTLSGYTEIEEIHLDGVPATDAELDEIERLLKGGVIL